MTISIYMLHKILILAVRSCLIARRTTIQCMYDIANAVWLDHTFRLLERLHFRCAAQSESQAACLLLQSVAPF